MSANRGVIHNHSQRLYGWPASTSVKLMYRSTLIVLRRLLNNRVCHRCHHRFHTTSCSQ